jgi:hypothetical protein
MCHRAQLKRQCLDEVYWDGEGAKSLDPSEELVLSKGLGDCKLISAKASVLKLNLG